MSKKLKPAAIEQILDLVRQLSDADFNLLMDELDNEDLRREVQKGLDSLERDGGIPADEVFREIRQKQAARKTEDCSN